MIFFSPIFGLFGDLVYRNEKSVVISRLNIRCMMNDANLALSDVNNYKSYGLTKCRNADFLNFFSKNIFFGFIVFLNFWKKKSELPH